MDTASTVLPALRKRDGDLASRKECEQGFLQILAIRSQRFSSLASSSLGAQGKARMLMRLTWKSALWSLPALLSLALATWAKDKLDTGLPLNVILALAGALLFLLPLKIETAVSTWRDAHKAVLELFHVAGGVLAIDTIDSDGVLASMDLSFRKAWIETFSLLLWVMLRELVANNVNDEARLELDNDWAELIAVELLSSDLCKSLQQTGSTGMQLQVIRMHLRKALVSARSLATDGLDQLISDLLQIYSGLRKSSLERDPAMNTLGLYIVLIFVTTALPWSTLADDAGTKTMWTVTLVSSWMMFVLAKFSDMAATPFGNDADIDIPLAHIFKTRIRAMKVEWLYAVALNRVTLRQAVPWKLKITRPVSAGTTHVRHILWLNSVTIYGRDAADEEKALGLTVIGSGPTEADNRFRAVSQCVGTKFSMSDDYHVGDIGACDLWFELQTEPVTDITRIVIENRDSPNCYLRFVGSVVELSRGESGVQSWIITRAVAKYNLRACSSTSSADTMLQISFEACDNATMDLLMGTDCSHELASSDADKMTLLHKVCEHPRTDLNHEHFEKILELGKQSPTFNINALNYCGECALMLACRSNRHMMANALLKAKACPQLTTNDIECRGRTALMYACLGGSFQCVELLLSLDNPCVNEQDEDGASALHLVCWLGHSQIAASLLDAGASLESRWEVAPYGSGLTPLMCASIHNHHAIVRRLLEGRADVEARANEPDRWTALFLACHSGSFEAARHLVAAGSDRNVQAHSCCVGWSVSIMDATNFELGQKYTAAAIKESLHRIVDLLLEEPGKETWEMIYPCEPF